MPRALITGITGQDGHHLAELLHGNGYEVDGLVTRRRPERVAELLDELPFVRPIVGDLADASSLVRAVDESAPDEVYNLGAMSSVAASFDRPELTADVTGLGPVRLLDAVRRAGGPHVRVCQASSSEVFGTAITAPQDESTRFRPRSPYGCSKVLAHQMVRVHREHHGMYACSAILFNHEGPRRGEEFITRKVTRAAARISLGLQDELVLGDLDARRDWGYAGDTVRAMWLMLQQDRPRDLVIATGTTHSIRDLVDRAFVAVGIDDWGDLVRQDAAFVRAPESVPLVGDAAAARRHLGWRPEVEFDELVAMMVDHDLRLARLERDRVERRH